MKLVFGIAALLLSTLVWAEEPRDVSTKPAATEPTEAEGKEATPLFSFDGGIDLKSAYFFRGYNVMDGGYIVQPELTLTLRPFEVGDFAISPYVGVWNNISETQGTKNWTHLTETDLIAGFEVEWKQFTFDVAYNLYTFPSGFSKSTQELAVSATYDDSRKDADVDFLCFASPRGQCAPIALNPHVMLFQEINDNADGQNNSGGEIGIAPALSVKGSKLELEFPLRLGFSLYKFYTNDRGGNSFFGYWSAGLEAKYPISENWFLRGGVEYIGMLADSTKDANDGNSAVVGSIGVAFSY